MKLIVAGGRDFTDSSRMDAELKNLVLNGTLPDDVELVCGMACGADITAYNLWRYVYKNEIHKFIPDWKAEPRRGGFIRNEEMAEFADFLVAFWDGSSRGTKHMIETMKAKGKPVIVFRY